MNLGNTLRWAGRLGSLLALAPILAFVIGDQERLTPTASEAVGLACFPVGVLAGLLLAWRNELVGGLLALGSLALFYVWHALRSGMLPGGPYFALFTSPAVLFLGSWLLRRPADVRTTQDI